MLRGTNVTYAQLAALAQGGHRIRRRRRVRSVAAGESRAHTRGRGVDFAEVRAYQAGDDVRTIDWRVTARKGRAHTKVFHEERDRQIWILVDQRVRMRFGTRGRLKSVAAADCAARVGWRVLRAGDRVGLLLVTEGGVLLHRAGNRRRHWLEALERLAEVNQALLRAPEPDDGARAPLGRRLEEPGRALARATSLVLVADAGEPVGPLRMALARLARHADTVLVPVHDPLDQQLPPAGLYPVRAGDRLLALDSGPASARDAHARAFRAHRAEWQALAGQLRGVCAPLGTDEDPEPWTEALFARWERRA